MTEKKNGNGRRGTPGGPAGLQIEQDDLVIFGEDGRFYLVQKTDYMQQELPVALMSAAEFVVGLGSIVSDISCFDWDSARHLTNNSAPPLTDRCACVVLNLAAIRQVSEKTSDQAVTFLKEEAANTEGRLSAAAVPRLHADGRKVDPDLRIGERDLVIFTEKRNFYWVKQQDYQLGSRELPLEMRSAPELMVKLGTVAADIPRIPTAGTACFLLNLLSLRKGTDHAARVLEENIQTSRIPDAERKAAEAILEEERRGTEDREKLIQRLSAWARLARDSERQATQLARLETLVALSARQHRLTNAKQQDLIRELRAQIEAAEQSNTDPAMKDRLQYLLNQLVALPPKSSSTGHEEPVQASLRGKLQVQAAAARTVREKPSASKRHRAPRGSKK